MKDLSPQDIALMDRLVAGLGSRRVPDLTLEEAARVDDILHFLEAADTDDLSSLMVAP